MADIQINFNYVTNALAGILVPWVRVSENAAKVVNYLINEYARAYEGQKNDENKKETD